MTFEYRDPDGGLLRIRPLPGISAVLVETGPQGCAVPADLAPDVVAGFRDTVRTATRQAGAEPTPCGNRSLPTSSGEVVSCVLDAGHTTQCRNAIEYPYVSWPNPSNGVWNPDADALMGEMSARAMNRLFPARAAQAQATKEKEHTARRAAVLDEAANLIEQLQTQLDGEIRAEYGELDRDTEVEGAATRSMAAMLRQKAEEAR